jgi:2-keto-4-pentenoate hydratase/2-oxohepta-3-ene-1,7-dioic acid hydratase in catechol pathway
VAMGLTYSEHVQRLGGDLPREPAATLKTYATLAAPGTTVDRPAICRQLDYEGEMVAVIGARPGADSDALPVPILGLTIGNDLSARDLQFRSDIPGMDLFSAKALDGTSPVGPWLVTSDEIGEGHPDLALEVTVDGEVRQRARTSSMSWTLQELIDYVNARVHLRCGDLLFTGSPPGVGHEDGRYLQPGQDVWVSIEKIGTLKTRIGPEQGPLWQGI